MEYFILECLRRFLLFSVNDMQDPLTGTKNCQRRRPRNTVHYMADRGRKAMPSANHILTQREVEHNMAIHHERLAKMGPTPRRCATSEFTLSTVSYSARFGGHVEA